METKPGEVLLMIAAKMLPQHCRTFFASLAGVAVEQHVQAMNCDRIALHLVHLLVESLHHTEVGLGQVVIPCGDTDLALAGH